MLQQYVEIGTSSSSKKEMLDALKQKGFVLVYGTFPFGKWLYSAIQDETLVDKDTGLETWYGWGTELNEVGEKFIDLRVQ